jgi:hypothetical protein
MADGINFKGANLLLTPPKGREEEVNSLPTFTNGKVIVSCWQLTTEELQRVKDTGGKVFLAVMGSSAPPVFLGDDRSVRALCADHGATFPRQNVEEPV